jgi:hypothetical protein
VPAVGALVSAEVALVVIRAALKTHEACLQFAHLAGWIRQSGELVAASGSMRVVMASFHG